MSQDSSLSKVTGYRLCNWGSMFGMSNNVFYLLLHPEWLWVPPTHISYGYHGLFNLEVNQPEHEADHPFPSSTMVMNALCYTSTPPYIFTVKCLSTDTILPLP